MDLSKPVSFLTTDKMEIDLKYRINFNIRCLRMLENTYFDNLAEIVKICIFNQETDRKILEMSDSLEQMKFVVIINLNKLK
jgi:hypothetical protein